MKVRLRLVSAGGLLPGFVWIHGGPTIVGDDGDVLGAGPRRRVEVGSFGLARFETTCREYAEYLRARHGGDPAAVLAHAPREGGKALWPAAPAVPPGWEELPVVGVSWRDATDYCAWRTQTSGGGVVCRLPSSLEWERAARGADGRAYPWGDAFDWTFAKLGPSRAGRLVLEPVGRFARDESPFGVRDLAGSVREWCQDLFDDFASTSVEDLKTNRVLRGGSWVRHSHVSALGALATAAPPDFTSSEIGFRVAISLRD